MMREHVLSEQIDRFRRGTLAPDEVLFVARHLAECDMCGAAYRNDPAALREVSEALTRDAGEGAGAPLAYAVAAAVIVALLGVAAFFLMRPAVAPPIARKPRPAAPVAITHLEEPPIVAQLRPAPGTLRGEETPSEGAMSPAGVVVEPAQPRFSWTAIPHARVVVSVFDGTKVVAESEPLATNAWTPPHPLPRGVTYTWQLEVRRGNDVAIVPAPPAPPAMFHVIDEASFAAIDDVRRRSAADHKLLGILYARAGMRQQAIEELSAAGDADSQRLLSEVRAWP